MITYNERAAEVMAHLVTDARHGYSQPGRKGDGTTETLTLSDGTRVVVHGGDYDCSEAVRMCYAAAGVLPKNSYMWTGNEEQLLRAHGFVQVSTASVAVGDVLWRKGHTELVISVGGRLMQAGFRIAETGGINGRKGDQTGAESAYSVYNAARWAKAFRYVGAQPKGSTQAKPNAADHVAVDGWIGQASARALQRQLGVTPDGYLSGQYKPNRKYYPRLTCAVFGSGGSYTVGILQQRLRAHGYNLAVDGVLGRATVTALQRWMHEACGYKRHAIDGYLGRDTAYNIQNALNAGYFAKL